MQPITVESGSRLADRYRLEEELEVSDNCAVWRAVDEKLSRPVGVRIVPLGHPRAQAMVEAARAAALVGDPRFLQVLDANDDGEVVYVVTEWAAGAVSLARLLAEDTLPAADAVGIAEEVAGALAAAHAAGQHHLRLGPGRRLAYRDRPDQGRRPHDRGRPARRHLPDPALTDTRAIASLLYAMLTGRWPGQAAHGLQAAPQMDGRVCSPRQVRAGVPIPLDQVTMQALVDTPPSGLVPLRTPAELAAALAMVPRPEPEPDYVVPSVPVVNGTGRPVPGVSRVPVARPRSRRVGQLTRLAVAGVLLAGLGLLGWQIGAAFFRPLGGADQPDAGGQQQQQQVAPAPQGKELKIQDAALFDPFGSGRTGGGAPEDMYDGNGRTAFYTAYYNYHPGTKNGTLGGTKPGTGMVFDLGSVQQVSSVHLELLGRGTTGLQIRVADESAGSRPRGLDDFRSVALEANAGDEVTVQLSRPVRTQYLLVWFTELPESDKPENTGKRQVGVAEITVKS
ncbi:protein kinase family protein [Carbonactinospora thermoautotrophica]|uniref:protein kinase family protein n=1 Tax=Carbonactinospora thermoautotrophica TaxID=1469144 RepID=UPI00082D4324|nr:protein kinase family protein [Carbonactinospora thermoautotrophica]